MNYVLRNLAGAARADLRLGEKRFGTLYQNALGWLRSVLQHDGGWGERCDSYEDPSRKGQSGPKHAQSDGVWAIMAFLSCGFINDPAMERGIRYLLSSQRPDGTWNEDEFTALHRLPQSVLPL